MIGLSGRGNDVSDGPNKIQFSSSYDNFGDHIKYDFTTQEDISMGFQFDEKANATEIKIIVLKNKDEQMVETFEKNIDPTWGGIETELYRAGELDRNLYTVRVVRNDNEVVAEDTFYVKGKY